MMTARNRPFLLLAACAALSLFCSARAVAATDVLIMTDRELGEPMARAVAPLRSATHSVDTGIRAAEAACAPMAGARPRLALLARVPSQAEVELCAGNARADAVAVPIARQAVALVRPAGTPVVAVNTTELFRAFTAHGPAPTAGTLLLAPTGSIAQRMFDGRVMESGCVAGMPAAKLPFDRAERRDFCAKTRADGSVAQRSGGAEDVVAWARSAKPGALAVVSVAELPTIGDAVAPVALDGVLPLAVDIAEGRYLASRQVALLIVLPTDTDKARRDAARKTVFNLLAEASIGPSGSLEPADIVVLSPAERVAGRTRALGFFE